MNKHVIIPSSLRYAGAPSIDQEIDVSLTSQNQNLIEYDSTQTISLSDVYDDERQGSTTFRPTFKVDYIYSNTITGTTNYIPFQYNLYLVDEVNSAATNIWGGFPQYYEFDFYRPNITDQHIDYVSSSAYNYNWMYYLTTPYENDNTKDLFFTSSNFGNIFWKSGDGIPFVIKNQVSNGSKIITFTCPMNHGLKVGEFVELSFSYSATNIFQIYSLGNGEFGTESKIFNIFNLGFTGNTFVDGKMGTFKRVLNIDNVSETKSKYYIRKHRVIKKLSDLVVTKNGFEKNVFNEEKKYFVAPVTPNNKNRVAQKTSSNTYNITLGNDLDINGIFDNQKRPITEVSLTIIFRGFSGYFNYPNNSSGLKQGWRFNITEQPNSWWNKTETKSDTNIRVGSYTKLQGNQTNTFYYNDELNIGDMLDGDFCEWNDYEQNERIVSEYYHKINFNQNVFTTVSLNDTNQTLQNSYGYYYKPHNMLTIKVFSDYIETANKDGVVDIPTYSYYSKTNKQFRWRDIYTYGFFDNLGRGVNYPFINGSHYPFGNFVFRLIPEGSNFVDNSNIITKPLIDDCE